MTELETFLGCIVAVDGQYQQAVSPDFPLTVVKNAYGSSTVPFIAQAMPVKKKSSLFKSTIYLARCNSWGIQFTSPDFHEIESSLDGVAKGLHLIPLNPQTAIAPFVAVTDGAEILKINCNDGHYTVDRNVSDSGKKHQEGRLEILAPCMRIKKEDWLWDKSFDAQGTLGEAQQAMEAWCDDMNRRQIAPVHAAIGATDLQSGPA